MSVVFQKHKPPGLELLRPTFIRPGQRDEGQQAKRFEPRS